MTCDMVRRDIIVLAASAGGVDALKGIVRILPAHLPAALFVVLHIGPNRSMLPSLLSQAGPLPASHPSHGHVIVPGAHLCGAARPSYAADTRVHPS